MKISNNKKVDKLFCSINTLIGSALSEATRLKEPLRWSEDLDSEYKAEEMGKRYVKLLDAIEELQWDVYLFKKEIHLQRAKYRMDQKKPT